MLARNAKKTRNRFKQAKHQSVITNSLSTSKARQLFLEDNGNIDTKNTYKITSVHSHTEEKDDVNKEYYDKDVLSFSNKIDILSKIITELRKGVFDKITTKILQLSHCHNQSYLYSHSYSQCCSYD